MNSYIYIHLTSRVYIDKIDLINYIYINSIINKSIYIKLLNYLII